MRTKTRRVAITAIVLAAVVLVVGLTTVALASPGSGVTASTPVSGTVAGKFNLNIAGFINFHTKGDLRVANQVFTIAPLGFVGWHSHPGPVLKRTAGAWSPASRRNRDSFAPPSVRAVKP